MFRKIVLTAALSLTALTALTALPALAQEGWSSGQILTPHFQPQYQAHYQPQYQPQYQARIRSYENHAPAYTPQRTSIIAHPVYTDTQIYAAGPTRVLPAQQRALPVIRDYGYQSARSQVRGGVVQYRAAEPGGTAFESGPGTETTVIQRGPDGVAVTVIYNP